MANNFQPPAPDLPMTLKQFNEQSELLSDIDNVSQIPIEELLKIQEQRQAFLGLREKQRERLRGQGLDDAAIDQLEQKELAAEPETELVPQTVERSVAGIVEGGKQAVEGVFDLAMDLSVALGTDDEASRAKWKDGVKQRRLEARQEHIEKFGRLPGGGSELIGNIIPWLPASSTKASTLTRFLGRNAMLGGTSAAAQFQPSEKKLGDRWLDVAFGTTLGAGAGILFGVPAQLKRAGARHLVKAFNDTDSQQREIVEGLVQEMTGNPEFKFSAAQITGSRFYANLEIGAAEKATKAQQNANLDTLLTNLIKTAKLQSKRGQTAGQIATGLRDTLKNARKQIYAQATSLWGRNSQAIIQTYGDDAVLRGKEYLHKVDEIIQQETNALTSMGGKPSANLLAYRDKVDELVNPVTVIEEGDKVFVLDRSTGDRLRILGKDSDEARKIAQDRAFAMNEASGGPNSEQVLDILNGLNRLIGGDAAVFENVTVGSNRNLGRALMGAFTSELEAAATNEPARNAINLLRQGYRADMVAAQAIDDTVMAAVFGGRNFPKQPGKALDRLLSQEPADLRATRQFLEEWNPTLLEDVQRTALKRAMLRSGAQPGAANVDGAVDLNKLANQLSDGFKREGRLGSGLFAPAVQKDIQLTAEALRILANKQFKGIVPGGTRVEEFTINLISRSPEFAGRFITRVFASGKGLEEALLSPEWRHALRIIATGDLASAKGKGALLVMTNWWAGREEQRKQEEQRAREAAAQQGFKGQLGD